MNPARPLQQEHHSLESDMIFGWRPRTLSCRAPIPLSFHHSPLPSIKNQLTKQRYPTIFHGYRPRDSYQMHKHFAGNLSNYYFNFGHPLASALQFISRQNQKKPDPSGRTFQGNKPGFADLQFDSSFQGRNLDKVVFGPAYYLYMRGDSNTRGHYKWFYFRCKNKGNQQTCKFCVVNFKYRSNLITQGMRPYYKSSRQNQWKQVTGPVQYKYSLLNNFTKKRNYYMLQFSHQFKTEQEVYFSLSIPYLYSDLIRFLTQLPRIVQQNILCKTLSEIQVPLLEISPHNQETVIILGRVHPSETVGSFVLEGIIKFLSSNKKEAEKLREKFRFLIVPMCNPDGVILGNSRTSFSGQDLNRRYSKPDQIVQPIPFFVKKLVEQSQNVFAVFDVHGHFTKKGSFIYGPHFPLHSPTYYNIRVLPKLLSKTSSFFRYNSCRFKNEKSKKSAARQVFSRELKIKYSYTIENSLFAFLDQQRNTQKLTTKSY